MRTQQSTAVKTELPPSGHITAPADNIQLFHQLMHEVQSTLSTGKVSFPEQPVKAEESPTTLQEKTIFSVARADAAAHRIQSKLTGYIDAMGQCASPGPSMLMAIAEQKFAATNYALGLNLAGNTASDTSEEVASVTRGR